jgi:carotenoid cleavage oxygenase
MRAFRRNGFRSYEVTTAATAKSQNPYLEGFLAPMSAEVTATDLPVTGHIPEHLGGRYLRNGPNPAKEVDPATYHWFTGDGMVHGVALRDGQARWYRNRWVRGPAVCAALGEQTPGGLNPRAGGLGPGRQHQCAHPCGKDVGSH